ncbi:MAG TPA: type II and III secretion system protein [bacterium]|nr:type II and III secretion system protein [bacterium]HQL61498.1 type II and III secretion system protein [bacterium]
MIRQTSIETGSLSENSSKPSSPKLGEIRRQLNRSTVFVLALLLGVASPIPCQRVIEIEAEVYEYRFDENKQIGLFHDWKNYSGDLTSLSMRMPGTERLSDDPLSGVDLNLDSLSLIWGTIQTRLIAAVRDGQATLLSSPTVIALEGTTAQIISGESFPVTQFSGVGTIQSLTERPLNTGVKLYVTPAVFREEYIVLSIQAESSEIRDQLVEFVTPDNRRYQLPQPSKRSAQTVVILRSGQSFYVGGLIQESEQRQVRAIPMLGNIPLFGRVFRGTNRTSATTETVFHIRPTILQPGEGSGQYTRLFGESPEETTAMPSVSEIFPATPDVSYLTSYPHVQ